MSSHIAAEQLRKLMETDPQGSFSLDEVTERHLQTCPVCQQALQAISADDDWWRKVADYLPSDAIDQATDKTLDTTLMPIPAGGRRVQVSDSSEWSADNSDAPHGDSLQQLTDATILTPATHPELLGRIGKYDIEEVIGRGGMGVVYRGYDSELRRAVAIKVLSPHLASNGTARKRFAREAQAAAAVVHPHAIPIYGVNSTGKLPYIVMPLICGPSIQQHVETDGPMEPKDIIRVALQIAAGLEAAHKQGLVHRDIKPANILMEENVSRVMITDFGLARAADDAAMTQTGWLAGTPHYMSPEQASGQAVDASSDLFSLGGTMYFMATGRVPFRADTPVAVLNLICHKRVVPVQQLNSDIPRSLASIIEKLLAKNPAHRFASAEQLHNLLEKHLAHLQHPDTIPEPKPVRNADRQLGRSMVLATAAATLLALAIGYASHINARFDGRYPSNGTQAPANTQLENETTTTPSPADDPLPPIPQPLMSNEELARQIHELNQQLEHVEDQLLEQPPVLFYEDLNDE